jgi:hypothetical protein
MNNDKWHMGFNGMMKSWYLNFGEGSFKTKDYGDGETDDIHFGYTLGTEGVEHLDGWEPEEEILEHPFTGYSPEELIDVTIQENEETNINGITEYGYGIWTRFVWNGPAKLVNKPAWMALARLTIQPEYQGDARQHGDRTLAIWVGAGYYHFTTYGIAPANVNWWKNLPYNQMLDGQWNYIYFCYKRFAENIGRVRGFAAFEGQTIREAGYANANNIIHYPLNDFLYFAVGSSGAKLHRNYQHFNGLLAKVHLRLGEGAYIDTADALREYIHDESPQPGVPDLENVRKTIVEDPEDTNRADGAVEPIEFEEDFAG